MMRGACIINVSRGGLIDTDAAIDALETGQLGGLGLDVYEHEGARPVTSTRQGTESLYILTPRTPCLSEASYRV